MSARRPVTARDVGCVIALALGGVSLAAAMTARWVETTLLAPEPFMAAVAPLARDQGVRAMLSSRVTDEILSRIDLEHLDVSGLPDWAGDLVTGVDQRIEDFTAQQVDLAVRSEALDGPLTDALRLWHLRFSAAVTARGPEQLEPQAGKVGITLGSFLDVIAERTREPALGWALRRVPAQIRSTVVAQLGTDMVVDRLAPLRWLHALRFVTFPLAIASFITGIVLSRRRSRGVMGAGLATLMSAALPALWLTGQREIVARALTVELGASASVADSVAGSLAQPLTTLLILMAAAGVAAILGGWVVMEPAEELHAVASRHIVR